MSDWPPPPDATTTWVRVWPRGGEPTLVRPVRLWGQRVHIDEADRVLCPGCLTFVDVAELTAPDNSHPVGIVRREGTLLPMATDDPAPPGEPSILDVEW